MEKILRWKDLQGTRYLKEMETIIASSFLVGSFAGMVVIALRNISAVRETELSPFSLFSFLAKRWVGFKNRVAHWWKESEIFSWNIILQKILSQIRVAALRVERKTGEWLSRTRQKNRKRKEREEYWKELSRLSRDKKD